MFLIDYTQKKKNLIKMQTILKPWNLQKTDLYYVWIKNHHRTIKNFSEANKLVEIGNLS